MRALDLGVVGNLQRDELLGRLEHYAAEQAHLDDALELSRAVSTLREEVARGAGVRGYCKAGDTPEMREAWPRVAGRIFPSFWRASLRRLGTVA